MKIGDLVLISPDLTNQDTWISGKIIKIEENHFIGLVISAETEDKNIFFGKADLFKFQDVKVCSH